MSDENPTTIEKPQESEKVTNDDKISINKSTYNKMLKGIIAAIAIATFFGGYSLGTMSDSGSDANNQELMAKIQELDKKIAQAPSAAQAPTPSAPTIIKVSLDDDPFKGDPDAPVTIVEFSDFQCPFCKRFVDQTLTSLEEEYIDTGKVKFVYRDFPLSNIHPNAMATHIAAECANEQDKFWEYHDALFETQSQWARISADDLNTFLKQIATDLRISQTSFDNCLDSASYEDEVTKDYTEGASYGTTGTPSFYIGTEKDGFTKLSGAQPFAVFKQNIDKLLES